MRRVESVESLGDYRLRLSFDDGAAGILDFARQRPFEGVFAVWNNSDYFRRVRVNVESGTLEWPNGVDLDPDELYREATGGPLPSWTRQDPDR